MLHMFSRKITYAFFACVFCITNKKPKWSSTPATADSGWTLARCCTDLTPCCCCFLPFLAPLPPCSHSFTLVWFWHPPSLSMNWSGSPTLQKTNFFLLSFLSFQPGCPGWQRGWQAQAYRGEWAEPPFPVVNSLSPPLETSIKNQSQACTDRLSLCM